jgi:hypothetical protein
MAYQLSFERLMQYDPGLSGITIDVTLKLFENNVSLTAKVDTGASYCIFERSHGEALGLSVESGLLQPISTATGRFITYGHEVTLSVAGFEINSMVYFAGHEEITRNVLGRHGWLDRVVLGLIDYEGKLLLSEYSG